MSGHGEQPVDEQPQAEWSLLVRAASRRPFQVAIIETIMPMCILSGAYRREIS
jgi:hypothetical protein